MSVSKIGYLRLITLFVLFTFVRLAWRHLKQNGGCAMIQFILTCTVIRIQCQIHPIFLPSPTLWSSSQIRASLATMICLNSTTGWGSTLILRSDPQTNSRKSVIIVIVLPAWTFFYGIQCRFTDEKSYSSNFPSWWTGDPACGIVNYLYNIQNNEIHVSFSHSRVRDRARARVRVRVGLGSQGDYFMV